MNIGSKKFSTVKVWKIMVFLGKYSSFPQLSTNLECLKLLKLVNVKKIIVEIVNV